MLPACKFYAAPRESRSCNKLRDVHVRDERRRAPKSSSYPLRELLERMPMCFQIESFSFILTGAEDAKANVGKYLQQ